MHTVHWALLIGRVPGCISKPVAGSEGGDIRRWRSPDLILASHSLLSSFLCLQKTPFLAHCPRQYICSWFPLPSQTPLYRKPSVGLCHFSGRQTVAICAIEGQHYPFPNPTYHANLNDFLSSCRLSTVFFRPPAIVSFGISLAQSSQGTIALPAATRGYKAKAEHENMRCALGKDCC